MGQYQPEGPISLTSISSYMAKLRNSGNSDLPTSQMVGEFQNILTEFPRIWNLGIGILILSPGNRNRRNGISNQVGGCFALTNPTPLATNITLHAAACQCYVFN